MNISPTEKYLVPNSCEIGGIKIGAGEYDVFTSAEIVQSSVARHFWIDHATGIIDITGLVQVRKATVV